MTDPKPMIIFHVGQHKTGSKALQSFLAHNRARLMEDQILYPVDENPRHGIQAYAVSHYRLFSLLRYEALAECAGCAEAEHYWRGQREYCRPHDSAHSLFEAIATERERSGARLVVMSAEDLFDMQTAHEIEYSFDLVGVAARRLARLAADFGFNARVGVFLRRQDHLLGMHYGQFIKGSPVHDLDFEAFAAAFAPRLDARRILSAWVSAFGLDCIRVLAYERAEMPGGIVSAFFDRILKVAIPPGCTEPAPGVESVNRSLNRDFIEFIRVLNRRTPRAEPVFAREDVLAAAFRDPPAPGGEAGIAAWMSPAARRGLLAAYALGNDAIAREIQPSGVDRLFHESLPAGDEDWTPYAGLTAERAIAISLAIHEAALTRQSCPPPGRDQTG